MNRSFYTDAPSYFDCVGTLTVLTAALAPGGRDVRGIVMPDDLHTVESELDRYEVHGFFCLPPGDFFDRVSSGLLLPTENFLSSGGKASLLDHLRKKHGCSWDADSFRREFEPLTHVSPYVVVRRRSDGARGSVGFIPCAGVYFGFTPH